MRRQGLNLTHVAMEQSDISDKKILIIGPNWLGDGVMAMPAVQAYKKAFPQTHLTMLVKPKMADLWTMHPAIDEVWTCPENFPGILRTAGMIRRNNFKTAFILPNSFRSALPPFLGLVPERAGFKGHFRSLLINKIIRRPESPPHYHQRYECAAILGVSLEDDEPPRLNIRGRMIEKARTLLSPEKKWIGLMPGAARGEAKRWLAEYFADLGRTLRSKHGFMIAVFGSNSEKDLCAGVRCGIGADALDLSGQTTLPELAAALSCCAAVVGNDSGGIHLAAAAGAAVVAVYGITDPEKTLPLGRKIVVLQESVRHLRDIPRRSKEAENTLRKITPQAVEEKLFELL